MCVVVCLAAAGALLAVTGPADDGRSATTAPGDPGPLTIAPQVGAGRYLALPGRTPSGAVFAPPAGRPPVPTTPALENPDALTPPVTSPGWASGAVAGAQVVIADDALPWTWWLDPAVADVVDPQVVRDAVAAWDGVPGSRWATRYAGAAAPATGGTGSRSGRAIADGRSTVFLEDACTGLTTANAYLFADGGLGVDRLGTRASQIVEADIGVCPGSVDPETLRRAVVHEVGHVIGFAHLCDPVDDCWREGMGSGPHGCRAMFWQARPCQAGLDDADREALATLYPRLRLLWGPSDADALARASFATWGDGTARAAVLLHPEVGGAVAAGSAALAGRLGGPLLTADPVEGACAQGAGARELHRVLARRARVVLVGPWPSGCDRAAHDWEVQARRVRTDQPTAAVLTRLAELAADEGDDVVLWAPASAESDVAAVVEPSLVVAAGLAAASDAPLRTIDPTASADIAAHAAPPGTRRAVVLGPGATAVADALRVGLPDVEVVTGDDATAISLSVLDLLAGGAAGTPLAVVDDGGGLAALGAVPVTARAGGSVIVSGPAVDTRLVDRLGTTRPAQRWVVGAGDLLPPPVRAAYGSAGS